MVHTAKSRSKNSTLESPHGLRLSNELPAVEFRDLRQVAASGQDLNSVHHSANRRIVLAADGSMGIDSEFRSFACRSSEMRDVA